MPRFMIPLCLLVLAGAPTVFAQESTEAPAETPAETPAVQEPAPLVDSQITIMNQSGVMLVQFEAIPILAEPAATDTASTDPASTDPASTDPASTATETATLDAAPAPDPRASAGGELLKGAVVSAGNYGILTVPGGASVCTFRIVSTLQDGRSVDETVDICLNPIYTLLPPA